MSGIVGGAPGVTSAARKTPIDGEKLEDLVGLCMSGGGYRAMLFHAGAVFRLNDLGLLPKLNRVSSVSGGSMTAAALALAYPKLSFNAAGCATNLAQEFLKPVLKQAEDSIDVASGFAGLNPFGSASDQAAKSYQRNLTGSARLASLPIAPTFVFNATNLMTGNTMRFRRDYIADHAIGLFDNVDLPLSQVVAASASFPPFLSPTTIDLKSGTLRADKRGALACPPFTETAVLTDGGVYDNLGTETVWKRCRTVLLSNAGRPFDNQPDPKENWLQQSLRVVDISMDQSEDLRERIMVHAYQVGARNGAMWGLTTGLLKAEDRPALLTESEAEEASRVSTRLWKVPKKTQALLLKAGYGHAASRIRAYYGPEKGGPADVPDGQWPTP
ncbi:patatin-like phospholipase family protein [Mesorhizobium sp. M1004]|uniref:patatin-like phospholipase family protein n=1 Tax=Mesorhizobium sp. M1004 TaxID=2957046 RepID=UPI003339B6C3